MAGALWCSRAQRKASLRVPSWLGHLGEEGGGIGIAHVVRVSAWREVDSNTAGLPDGGDGVDDLQQETQAVFERSAVFVRWLVESWRNWSMR